MKKLFITLLFTASLFSDHPSIYFWSMPYSGEYILIDFLKFALEANPYIARHKPGTNKLIITQGATHDIIKPTAHSPTLVQLTPFDNNSGIASLIDTTSNYLVVILRNYKECIPQFYPEQSLDDKGLIAQFENNSYDYQRYMDSLKLYETWDKDTRLLLYYEDFILKPVKAIRKLQNLMPEYKDEIKAYYAQVGDQLTPSKEKKKELKKSFTKYSSTFETSTLKEVDSIVDTDYPELYPTYLEKEYATK